MIQAGEITSYTITDGKTVRANGAFKHSDIKEDKKHLIYKAIRELKNYIYFDKFGNVYTIEEIKPINT